MICFLLISTRGYTQSNDRTAIESLIEDLYFEGWMTGDTTLVGKAMHSSCKLKVFRNGEFIETDRATYLSRFKPTTRSPETSGRILSIDITGNIASAKCELETAKALFTDYFNLMHMEDGWVIVDKVSVREDKK